MSRPRLHPLDLIALALLAAGVTCVLTGLLPGSAARDVIGRITPLLLFLASVIVLAELATAAEVFDVIATRIAIIARGNCFLLFLLCAGFATVTTVTLNLDTTAVLLTPVMLALADKVRMAAVPLAMTTVWTANTAGLLLPVSNLTNLLAQDRIGLDPLAFARRMWAAELVSVALTMVFLWLFYWRRSRRGVESYVPPPPHRPPDKVLLRVSAAGCLGFVLALLVADVPLWMASASAAGVVVIAFAVRDRGALTPALLPWRLLVFVTGLFLVIETIGRHGLSDLMAHLIGTNHQLPGMYRAAAAGAGLSNLVNNLPAYLAGEPAAGYPNQLLALLVGVNVGAIVTPWASLATLLWYERCTAAGVRVPIGRFMLTGTVLALTALTATVAVLAVT